MPEGTKPLFYNFRTGQAMPCRVQLLANRTYYVRSDGRDTNSGLVDSASGAFLTIQKAIDVVKSIDLGIYNVTIQVRDGTFAPFELLGSWIGGGRVTLLGNTTTPTNCIVQETTQNDDAIGVFLRAQLDIAGFRVLSANQNAIHAGDYSTIDFVGAMEFGSTPNGAHIRVDNNSIFFTEGRAISITAGAKKHIFVDTGGIAKSFTSPYTLTGTPNFTDQFVLAEALGTVLAPDNTFTGAATGQRYLVQTNSVIDTGGGGANYFPGNVAGAAATGGQYL